MLLVRQQGGVLPLGLFSLTEETSAAHKLQDMPFKSQYLLHLLHAMSMVKCRGRYCCEHILEQQAGGDFVGSEAVSDPSGTIFLTDLASVPQSPASTF